MRVAGRNTRTTTFIYGFLLGVAILLGTALRLHALGERSLWGDEITQATWARQSLVWIYTLLRPSFEAALGTYILHFVRILGESEFMLRLPGVMFGVLSLALIYRLGRRLFDPATGVLAALLLSVSSFHLAHSQEVHPYTLVVLLTLLSLDCFVTALRRPTWGVGIVWVVATVLGLYAHPLTVLVFAAEMGTVVLLAIRERQLHAHALPLRQFLLAGVLIMLLWLPEIMPAVPDLTRRSTARGGIVPTAGSAWIQRALSDLWGMLQELAREFSGAPEVLAIQLAFLAVGVMGAWLQKRRASLLLCLLVLSLPLVLAPFRSSSALFFARYFIFMLPIFLILVAHGMSVLLQSSGRWIARLFGDQRAAAYHMVMPLVLSCLMLVGSAAPVQSYYRKGNHDWRGLARYLAQNVRSGDAVIQVWAWQPNSLAWYFHPPEGVRVLLADEMSKKSLELPPEGRAWWVFIQQAQHQRLKERMGDAYEIALFYGLSVLHSKQGHQSHEAVLDAAVQLLELESEIHTDESQHYHRLATGLLQQGGHALAKFYVNRGDDYYSQKRWREAEEAYQRAIVCWPEWGTAHTRLGNTYRKEGEIDNALAAYQHSIQVEPGYVGAYLNVGSILQARGQGSEAMDFYRNAVQVAPESPWAHSTLGTAQLDRGEEEEALAHLRLAVDLEPNNVTWLLALADGYRKLGLRLEAISTYRQVLTLEPGNRQAAEALDALVQ